jgi:predicted alpha/beta hydrolase family esterase
MTTTSAPTVVIVPGLRGQVAEHWQTLLADALASAGRAARTVPPLTQNALSREARVAALGEVMSTISGEVVLIAHSAGCITTVHWAQRHRTSQVRGGLLATPPDLDTPMHEPHPGPVLIREGGWLPVPRTPLPFPSIVAASTDDPLARLDVVVELARDWGSRLVEIGAVGHLNPASGYGSWPRAEEFLRELDALSDR